MPLVSGAAWTVLTMWRGARQGLRSHGHPSPGEGPAPRTLRGEWELSAAKGENLPYLGLRRLLFTLSLEPCHLLTQGAHLAFEL